MSVSARVVVKAAELQGKPKESDFKIEERKLPELQDKEVLFKSLFISPDPYQRMALDNVKIGDVVPGSSVAEVLESKHSDYKKGDYIVVYAGWVSHGIQKDFSRVLKHNPDLGPPNLALGVLGMPAKTAYFGTQRVCEVKKGDIFVVSAAAGAVGSIVVQLGKIWGATVIAFAGTDDKCEYVKSLGADHCLNYKTCGPIKEALKKVAPDGIDCYFDNVGGEILDAVLMSLRDFSRVAICGQISEYNNLKEPSQGPRLYVNLIYKNAKIEGFVCGRWDEEWPKAREEMAAWIKEDKIKFEETIEEGDLDAVPRAFIKLLSGGNVGKQLVKLTQ